MAGQDQHRVVSAGSGPVLPEGASSPLIPGLPARFTVERRLGAGGFGAVYRVFDHARGEPVALKKLERADPSSLYRFKQEWRALADLRHPHLVPLYELFSADGIWCFTMELVEGVRFDRWVLGDAAHGAGMAATQANTGEPSQVTTAAERAPPPTALPRARLDEARLRAALAGLVSGVLALHRAGILHRDLKPSNVLVRNDGRVSILDFGLVATGIVDVHQSLVAAGTPAYMSPEQALGGPVSAASDFYAVGVMLYELLAGQPPFSGTAADILAARARRPPRDPRTLQAGLPDDLVSLCLRLLSREPRERPSGVELARDLGLAPVEAAGSGTEAGALPATFVGRKAELATLADAFATAKGGRPVTVHLHGPPGVGKTALLRRFLSDIADGDTVVLEGRCYERESVPYKALDPVIDALGRYLRRIPRLEAARLLPRDGRALVRLFPTLGQLELMEKLPGREPAPDPHELRRRAFTALREMLARLTDAHPLVIGIDDVQWGDADSAAFLEALFAPPDPPPALLVLAYRAAAAGAIPAALRQETPATRARMDIDLPVRPLSAHEAGELARALLGGEAGGAAEVVAHESGGSPLFIGQLARAASAGRRSGTVSLRAVLASRLAALPESARRVLDVLACAGRPQDPALIAFVAELDGRQVYEALDVLRAEHLVGATEQGGAGAVEILHDEVAESVKAELGADRARHYHQRLADRLEQDGAGDPEALTEHLLAAGDTARASRYAERAGDRASEALAFAHAVRLLRQALASAAPEHRERLEEKLGNALAAAGHGAEAAAVFLSCADRRTGSAALELRRRAAHQLLRAGRISEGLETVRPVLEDTGIKMQRTPKAALVGLIARRLALKLRGLDFVERRPAEIPERTLRRIDLCWSLSTGLVGIDLVRSADFQARNLNLALDAGEPVRIARALALQAAIWTLENHAGLARGKVLAARALALAERLNQPEPLGWARCAHTLIAWAEGRLADCVASSEEASAVFRDRCQDNYREMGSLEAWFNLYARFLMGQIETVAIRASACVAEARARGDLYTESTARTYIMPLVWLAVDRPDDAREEAKKAIAAWGDVAWHHQHWAETRAQCLVDLYEGQGGQAAERIEATRKRTRDSLLLRVRTPRVDHTYLEARGLLDRSWEERPDQLLARVAAAAARLEEEQSPLATVYAGALRAGIAARSAGPEESGKAFAASAEAFATLAMPMHAAAARRRRGELIGGDEGKRLAEEADATLGGFGVVAPARFARLLVPRASRGAGG